VVHNKWLLDEMWHNLLFLLFSSLVYVEMDTKAMKLQIFYILEQYINQCPPNVKGSEPVRYFLGLLRVALGGRAELESKHSNL